MHAFQPVEHQGDLRLGKNHGQPDWLPGALHPVQPGQLDGQHLLVEEQQRALGLVLRTGRDVAHRRQVRQERLHLPRAHPGRVPLAVKKDEAFNPVQIGLLGAQTVVLDPDLLAHALEQGNGGEARDIDGGG